MQVLVGLALIGLAIPLAWRLLQQQLLWSLRNKLILTYLLIGLAPVVLFLTLAGISAYIAAGQFSIHLADSRIRQQLEEMGSQNSASSFKNGARGPRPGRKRRRGDRRRWGSPDFRADPDLQERGAAVVLLRAERATGLGRRHGATLRRSPQPPNRPKPQQLRHRQRLQQSPWVKKRPTRCWQSCIGTPRCT